MTPIHEARLCDILTTARRASDMLPEQLSYLARIFQDAHEHAPGGLSIEVGTRKGGSAWLMLAMLREMYDDATRPMLFTVDPYGGKPYVGGDTIEPGLYGRNEYKAARTWLAEFTEHAHFYMTAKTFFKRLLEEDYYLRGEEHVIDQLTFVLLDGEHAAESILNELAEVVPHMRVGGVVLIDNADKDALTRPGVEASVRDGWDSLYIHASTPGAAQMIVRRRA